VRGLLIAAWTVFLLDTGLVMLFLVFAMFASTLLERDAMVGLTLVSAAPLAALFAILGLSTVYRKRAGVWISLVLGAAPLILLLILFVQQNFL
jgi:hypothetical protein